MTQRFAAHEQGATVDLDDDEKAVLIHLFSESAEFLAADSPEPDADESGTPGSPATKHTDPLAALVGIGEDAETPEDPALRRLLPDAYPDDDQASREFRRLTQDGLRARKLANAITVLETLHADGPVVLDQVQAHAWLTALTDLRLVLGERLGITDDPASQEWDADAAEHDPRVALLAAYDWLGYLQETLVEVLAQRLD